MPQLQREYDDMIQAMDVEGLTIPTTLVKFYRHTDPIPPAVLAQQPEGMTFTSCQANRQASIGDALCLTRENIGCIAAAISLGLVDAEQETPLDGPRVYTEIMREHAENRSDFRPPSPKDFTDGLVYACRDAKPQFCLFGNADAGRYRDAATAKAAIREMPAIQPAVMRAVFFYAVSYDELEIAPDVVVMSVRPVELTRILQAYQYNTGKRIRADMGGLRAVNADLIARPYLTGEINLSPYCLGSRLIAQYEPDRLGMGMPYAVFHEIVRGMADSRTGFPFHLYPGAAV